jgi:hypothetical protein
MLRRLLLPALLTLGGLAAAAPGASATTSTVRVGIADQSAAMFSSPRYQALDLQRTRYFIKWNAADDPALLAQADAFVAAARARGVDVLMHVSTDDFDVGEGTLPSPARYRSSVGKLVSRYYARGVREWGVWNEANDRTQPTYKSPTRAAEYFVELWRMLDNSNRCGATVTRKCRIVALDILDGRTKKDQGNARSYIRRFFAKLSPTYDRRASVIGIHNYTDTNRRGRSGTKNVITEAKKGNRNANFWLTETGGIVKLGNTGDFTCSATSTTSQRRAESRANRAVSWMFTLAKEYRRDVDRLYVYQWTGSDCARDVRFDAGLTRRNGSARPGLNTVVRQLRDSSILRP